jgi:hypothetical protein
MAQSVSRACKYRKLPAFRRRRPALPIPSAHCRKPAGATWKDTMRTQVTFDAADPHALAAFWAGVLGTEVEDHSDFVDRLVTDGRASGASSQSAARAAPPRRSAAEPP